MTNSNDSIVERPMNTIEAIPVFLNVTVGEIESFCKRWKIKEFALFGSSIRDDFDLKNSDVDILISFLPDTKWGWEIVQINEELELLFKRPVDIINKKSIERSSNQYRRQEILGSYKVIYEQAA
jgi:predicted nucleotidyltransferase